MAVYAYAVMTYDGFRGEVSTLGMPLSIGDGIARGNCKTLMVKAEGSTGFSNIAVSSHTVPERAG